MFTCAADAPAAEWGKLTDNPYEKPGWFRFNEACYPDTRFFYFCAFQEGSLAAVLPAYDTHSELYANSTEFFAKSIQALAIGMRFLIGGSPTTFRSDVIGPRDEAKTLIQSAVSWASRNGYDLLSLPFAHTGISNPAVLRRPSLVDFNLKLDFDSFDGYLASLSSTKRQMVRKELRNPPVITHLDLAGHENVMYRLHKANRMKYGASEGTSPDFYRLLAAFSDRGARIVLAGDVADPRGAMVYFISDEGLWLFHSGFLDRDRTYFHVVYYESIRIALERGLRFINFRPSSDHAKLLRGCSPEQLYFNCLPTSYRGSLCLQQAREIQEELNLSPAGESRAGAEDGDIQDHCFAWKVRRRMRCDRNPVLAEVQNKISVRDYARARGVAMARLLHVTQRARDMPFDKLPGDCFIKASHGTSWNVLRKHGRLYAFANGAIADDQQGARELTRQQCTRLFAKWLASVASESEWAYTVMQRHILVEEVLYPRRGEELMDYRFYTFNGKVRAINVGSPEYRRKKQNIFLDPDWNVISLTSYLEALPDPRPESPDTLTEMKAIASRLGEGLDFVRVDLFDTTGGIMLGEMTVYPQAGRADSPTACPVFNHWLGCQWRMPDF